MTRMSPPGSPFAETVAARRTFGTFLKIADHAVLDICAQAGFDFAIVDLQHSQIPEGEALRLVNRGWIQGFPVVVRLPDPDSALCNRLLEAGVAGIQLAEVRRVSEIERLRAATHYPPHGHRSVSLAHPVARYGATPLREAISVGGPLLVAQIETAHTDDPVTDIVGAGIDVAFLGITDLTVDFEFDMARVEQRVDEVRGAASEKGVALGVFAADPTSIIDGATYVAVSSDVTLLTRSFSQTVATARDKERH